MSTTTKPSVSRSMNRNGDTILRVETETEVTFSAWRMGVDNAWGETMATKHGLAGRIGTQGVDKRFPMFAVPSFAAQQVMAYRAILDSRFADEITGAASFKATGGKIVLESAP